MSNSSITYKYTTKQKIAIATDCIIFGYDGNTLKLLLFRRKVNPYKNNWSLIGSLINDQLSVEENAKKILLEHTGINNIYMEQFKTYGKVNRDPVERVISIVYYSLIRINELNVKEAEQHQAKWFDVNNLPSLVLDHKQMVDDAMLFLLNKVKHHPFGLNLMPEYFTIPQLLKLYESIYQKKIDPSNFRKKMKNMNSLIKTKKKDKSSSKKGAYLYKFNTKTTSF